MWIEASVVFYKHGSVHKGIQVKFNKHRMQFPKPPNHATAQKYVEESILKSIIDHTYYLKILYSLTFIISTLLSSFLSASAFMFFDKCSFFPLSFILSLEKQTVKAVEG